MRIVWHLFPFMAKEFLEMIILLHDSKFVAGIKYKGLKIAVNTSNRESDLFRAATFTKPDREKYSLAFLSYGCT
jgi:hypothetical protein